jgi:hypothetical protein
MTNSKMIAIIVPEITTKPATKSYLITTKSLRLAANGTISSDETTTAETTITTAAEVEEGEAE